MPLLPDLMTFVQAAVRLPEERLKLVNRAWDQLHQHRAVLTELVQHSEKVRQDVRELRDYLLAEARRAANERPDGRLIPEDLFEAVFPAARALLLRRELENTPDQRQAQAFAALTAPFADILPSLRAGPIGAVTDEVEWRDSSSGWLTSDGYGSMEKPQTHGIRRSVGGSRSPT
jgi:hypothetical protein